MYIRVGTILIVHRYLPHLYHPTATISQSIYLLLDVDDQATVRTYRRPVHLRRSNRVQAIQCYSTITNVVFTSLEDNETRNIYLTFIATRSLTIGSLRLHKTFQKTLDPTLVTHNAPHLMRNVRRFTCFRVICGPKQIVL